MTAKQWILLCGVLALGGAGCGESKAYVECAGIGTGFNCSVTHQEGSSGLNVCWQIKVVCQNGTNASANACQAVQPGAKSTRFVPLDKIQNADACDVATSVAVENLKLSEI